jgi:hypothetical protein
MPRNTPKKRPMKKRGFGMAIWTPKKLTSHCHSFQSNERVARVNLCVCVCVCVW